MTPIGKYTIAINTINSFFILVTSIYTHDLVKVIPAALFAYIGSASVRVMDLVASDVFISFSPVERCDSGLSFKGQDSKASKV